MTDDLAAVTSALIRTLPAQSVDLAAPDLKAIDYLQTEIEDAIRSDDQETRRDALTAAGRWMQYAMNSNYPAFRAQLEALIAKAGDDDD
jgi:hypothetical protein